MNNQTCQKKNIKNTVITKKMEEEQEQEKQPTTTTGSNPHSDPAFALKMLVDSRNAGAVLGTL
tara:strand:+ start:131 stop:319 length:189 start_codon:yes stop_codon:yes gene_type:complete